MCIIDCVSIEHKFWNPYHPLITELYEARYFCFVTCDIFQYRMVYIIRYQSSITCWLATTTPSLSSSILQILLINDHWYNYTLLNTIGSAIANISSIHSTGSVQWCSSMFTTVHHCSLINRIRCVKSEDDQLIDSNRIGINLDDNWFVSDFSHNRCLRYVIVRRVLRVTRKMIVYSTWIIQTEFISALQYEWFVVTL